MAGILNASIITWKITFCSCTPCYGGFWGMAHEARTDFSMLLGSIFLLIVGAGALSVDARLSKSDG